MTGIPPQRIRKRREKSTQNPQNPGRRRWILLLLLVAIIASGAAFLYPGWKAQAEAGVAYGARVGCSCLYVQGRNLDSCESDFEPGMGMVSLSKDDATKTATAKVRFLTSRSARFSGANGCILDEVAP